ncbi:MAG: hypothetical protein SWE60_02680 [Thermodesulfobacteriota bacterium]|nr:hypothetical protein [Thermodesulfobacteriota bacterium]
MRYSAKKLPALMLVAFAVLLAPFTLKLAEGSLLSLSDEELATQFAVDFGSANLVTTDLSGLGVEFYATNVQRYFGAKKVGISDKYEVSPLAGGTGAHNADFTDYDSYALNFKNTGSSAAQVSLYMNTGFTGASGHSDADTFWGGPWVTIPVGATVRANLDFGNAETWNAEDDPVEAWRYADGTWNDIFRLDEVTNIGFQLIPADGTEARLVVSTVPIPTSLSLLASGLIGLVGLGRAKSQTRH